MSKVKAIMEACEARSYKAMVFEPEVEVISLINVIAILTEQLGGAWSCPKCGGMAYCVKCGEEAILTEQLGECPEQTVAGRMIEYLELLLPHSLDPDYRADILAIVARVAQGKVVHFSDTLKRMIENKEPAPPEEGE